MSHKPVLVVGRKRLVQLLSLSLLVTCGTSAGTGNQPPQPGANKPIKKLALLVGINKYVDAAIPRLRGAENDTRLMHDLLSKDYDFGDGDIVVLTDARATRDAILKAFKEHLIDKADKDTVVVFHYSGHGSQVKDVDGDEGVGDRWDETIVPYDSGRSEGTVNRDILDDELGALFEELRSKTPYITFIFDSCNSGEVTREIDQPRELVRDERDLPARPVVGGVPQGDRPRDYAQISGCRENERSFELTQGNEVFGALTYHLVREIQEAKKSGRDVTYRDVMDQVRSAVTAAKPLQHPKTDGTGLEREIFGIKAVVAEPYVLVSKVDAAEVKFSSGRVHGLTPRSVLDVYAPGTKDFKDSSSAVARVELTSVESLTSTAKVVRVADGKQIALNCRAVVRRRNYESTPPRLAFYEPEKAGKEFYEKVRSKLRDENYPIEFKEVTINDNPLLTVRLYEEAGGKRVALLAGDAELAKSSYPAASPASVDDVADRLVDWANWYNVLGLKNSNSAHLASLAIEPIIGVKIGDKITFIVNNLTNRDVYFAILDISNDGTIGQFAARGTGKPLPSMQSWTSDPGEAVVPDGDTRKAIIDHFLLIATQQPVDFSFLEQKARGAKNIVNARDAVDDPLTTLLKKKRFGDRQIEIHADISGWSTDLKTIDIGR